MKAVLVDVEVEIHQRVEIRAVKQRIWDLVRILVRRLRRNRIGEAR